jgi:phosphoethanolamine N-methyltransferase
MSGEKVLYDDESIEFLEAFWGEGYLSPGGPAEVARVLDGSDLRGRRVLDIGCGAGGITVSLARDYRAAEVVGIDVEGPVCETARKHVREAGLQDRVHIRQVEPGPLPFPDASFDVVFSKEAIVHIPDKEALARDVFRVLRPGGWFIGSDWLISHDGAPSPEMAEYIAAEALDFGMASPRRYEKALAGAGFTEIRLVNRNPWYREEARRELGRLTGDDRARLERLIGAENVEKQIRTWTAMTKVLDTGEHCPHHLRARKPEA